MFALLLASVLTVHAGEPVRLPSGTTVQAEIDLGGQMLIYGGSFRAEDESIAMVSGRVPVGGSRGTAIVEGRAPGHTRLLVSFVSGLSVWRIPVGVIVVDEPCFGPAVTLPAREVRVLEGQPVTLSALTSGTLPIRLEWFEEDVLLGAGDAVTLTLAPGLHRIRAIALNGCGSASSGVVEVSVIASRRRSARH
jgi:hypothetical protein